MEKAPLKGAFNKILLWEADGDRTHDPQNHNLML